MTKLHKQIVIVAVAISALLLWAPSAMSSVGITIMALSIWTASVLLALAFSDAL